MKSLSNIVNRLLSTVTVFVFAVLVVCVVWQVVSRFILGQPSTVTDEMARFMFMWIGLIGAAYTLGQRRHLAIDLLTGSLVGRTKLLSDLFITLAIAVFAITIMLYGGSNLVTKTLATGQLSPALRIPMGYIYAAIPFSGAVILFYCVEFAIGLINGTGTGPNDQPVEDAAE
ncbi:MULTISPECIES: TRAP transporter small permease [Pseudovibrio]|uniref:TRAP transporter small permease n=1 Tax=Stappiaceae TaxID=2821832 RepID=UPI0023655147|nr:MULTISPECIES: TRAP transporter small permease [Pseudovibrio]MDD7910773.1 TRAP transporter small permease [Pseudovibrio exalbescens]MDX5593518.1 TRAP transporter small permease [Pseudovibrio sp. SPO723]